MIGEAHIIQLNPRYNWIRSRQLEGTFPGDQQTGVWPISSQRVAYGWGSVPLANWPLSTEWPPVEPDGLDEVAKRFRILFYQRVRQLTDCKIALEAKQPVVAAFEITEHWFDAPSGRIPVPRANEQIIGSHAITLLRINASATHIKFVNSWGEKWGDEGFGYLPVEYFRNHFVSGWIMEAAQRENEATDHLQYLSLGYVGILGDTVHVREIYDPRSDTRMGWAIAVQRGDFLDIEDFFVRPEFRGRGFGRELCTMVRLLAKEINLRMQLWFSLADVRGPVEEHLCESMGLTLSPSEFPWARFVASEEPPIESRGKSFEKPKVWIAPKQG